MGDCWFIGLNIGVVLVKSCDLVLLFVRLKNEQYCVLNLTLKRSEQITTRSWGEFVDCSRLFCHHGVWRYVLNIKKIEGYWGAKSG